MALGRREDSMIKVRVIIGFIIGVALCGCEKPTVSRDPATDGSGNAAPSASPGASNPAQGSVDNGHASARPAQPAAARSLSRSEVRTSAGKVKFRPYEIIDTQQGGLVVSRIAIPQDWKASSRVVWNYRDFYLPVHIYARAEAPDGASWMEFFPAEFFIWLDPRHDRQPAGSGSIGGIHHPNITLPEAMARYVIARNRTRARNLRIIGSRPVKNLPQAFPHAFDKAPQGEGICMRVHYELDGSPVDEEFYGFMTTLQTIPSSNPRFQITEYLRMLLMAHSIGAKSGKLESVRPLLGFVATSLENNPGWQKRFGEIKKMQGDYYARVMKANYAGIRAAGERSRQLTAQSDQFLRGIDANLAQSRAQRSTPPESFSSSSNEEFYKRADDFDQNLRGTEHMQDQYGQVSDQYNDYNYHWTDGFGRFVHTDDPNYDPNKYLIGDYQQMTPAPR
jgi:hypothetical protein